MTNKIKDIMCEVCGISFAWKGNYNRHFKKKHSVKKVKCLKKSAKQHEPQSSCPPSGSTTNPQKEEPTCSINPQKEQPTYSINPQKAQPTFEINPQKAQPSCSSIVASTSPLPPDLRWSAASVDGTILITAQAVPKALASPDVKRGRGRRRKQRDTVEEDFQCSNDDKEFEEVSEDEKIAASILDQGEGLQSTIIGAVHPILHNDVFDIQAEVKMEPPEIDEDNSMDLDRNYDPPNFLAMHDRVGGNVSGAAASSNENQEFLPLDAGDRVRAFNASIADGSAGHYNVGIYDDLAISEGDKENNSAVTVKNEPLSVDEMMAENVSASSAGDCEIHKQFLLDIGKEEIQDRDDSWLMF